MKLSVSMIGARVPATLVKGKQLLTLQIRLAHLKRLIGEALLTTHMESGSIIPKRMNGHVGNRVGISGDKLSLAISHCKRPKILIIKTRHSQSS